MNNLKSILIIIAIFFNTSLKTQSQTQVTNDSLPEDFTPINAQVFEEPSNNDYIFFAYMRAWNSFPDLTPYLIIADNYGTPVFYKKFDSDVMDFKLQPNGLLSYHDDGLKKHLLMDSTYVIVDTISFIGNPIDFHDFQILNNGNYLLLGVDIRLVDMDTVVEGGQPGATVVATEIQIQDPDENIIFEWSAWDHFQITDSYVDLLSSGYIDFTHTNAVEMDTDSTLLISNRNMYEITKINMNSGEIIWRLGGKNNMFTYIGEDTLGFAGQHDIRRLPDGTYQLFDNGWNHIPLFSCALQLDLDEENMTAKVVKRLRSQPEDILGSIMGNAQKLPNGNTIVGWGDGDPNITEFDTLGNKIVEFSYEAVSYRAFKFPWETKAFELNRENLNFEETQPGDSSSAVVIISNNLSHDLEINRLVSRTGAFFPSENFPVSIPAGDSKVFEILFIPDSLGLYNDVLTIANDVENDTLTQRIAKQITVKGRATEDASIPESQHLSLNVYPNPTKAISTIKFGTSGIKYCKLFDIKGQLVREFSTQSENYTIDITSLNKGVYLLKVLNNEGKNGIIKILKQ